MAEKRIFTVEEADSGVRLDKFLVDKIEGFSRNEIQKFETFRMEDGVEIPVKSSSKVKEGEVYEVIVPVNDVVLSDVVEASNDFELQILFEDDDIIVVNKPRGVVMYPAAGNSTGTLVQNVLAHTELSGLGGELRPGVVHRLDKDTSGTVVMAKSDAAYRELVKKFADHDIVRKYITFVWGIPNWETAEITGNIARSARNRQKMSMVQVGGREAKTDVEVVNIYPREKITELRCILHTGRTHQIRVHLSSHGFPVLCDPVYGRGSTRLGSVKDLELLDFLKETKGQMLHAQVLEFDHPITGERLEFRTRLPEDMLYLKSLLQESL